MKILHLMLSCFYIDNAGYQENIIPMINQQDGHDVRIIASTEVFVNNNMLGYVSPTNYLNEHGIPVIRLPYITVLNKMLSRKVRAYSQLFQLIEEFHPEVILFHGTAAFALLTVAKYKRKFPSTLFYVDSHEDLNNSAKSFVSRFLLHKLFYKPILHFCLRRIDKILYITYETHEFLRYEYRIPENRLAFFPLGGILSDASEMEAIRREMRDNLGCTENETILIHSGKLDSTKKTIDIVQAFYEVKDPNFRLIIIGSIDEDVYNSILTIIDTDPRIRHVGWVAGNMLRKYLIAGDLYVQPGSQSVTMQEALCCGCAVALYPYLSHKYLLGDSAFYVENKNDLTMLFKRIESDKEILNLKRSEAHSIAKNLLDYRKISSMLYRPQI